MMLKKLFKVDDSNAVRPARVIEESELGSDYDEVSWNNCFDRVEDIDGREEGSKFRLYIVGDVKSDKNRFVWLFVHGAGQTSLVWSHLVSELRSLGHSCMIAYDARGHGQSHHSIEQESDLSVSTLAADCAHIVAWTKKKCCLVGHSMGGSTVVSAAHLVDCRPSLCGVVVLDVVEGTALASLPSILTMVNSRPQSFSSPSQAVRWAVDSASVRSKDSARVSVPSQLKKNPETDCWEWRTQLGSSYVYWEGWYKDMSNRFLSIPLPKMLILAGTDRLDTPLTIGQMQGKYQLEIFPQCGHQVQEEAPKEISEKLNMFSRRF